jgi:DNA-3-methyladenine glycosylase II
MWEQRVEIKGPYHFDLALDRLANDPLHHVDMAERKVKVPIYEPEPEVAIVQAVGTVEKPVFIITGRHNATKTDVIKQVYHIFQWNVGLHAISDHFYQTSLKSIFETHRGTPIVQDFSLYSCLVKCIVHQQLNMKFAQTLTERFVHTFGFEMDGVWFYPSPEKTAELTVEVLRGLQFSQRKAEYLIGLSQLIASGEISLQELAEKTDEEILSTLVKIRGVGPWTVQNFLLFGLGRANLFPKADIGIQNAIKKLFQLDAKPTHDEMGVFSMEWEPYLSYASLYLWRSIETKD